MRLKSIYVGKYKHLEDFRYEFREIDSLINPAAYRFFIGRNGSGKSALLEALGLILTRVIHDESPGFAFEIVYTITVENVETEVSICNNFDLYLEHCKGLNTMTMGEETEPEKTYVDCLSKIMVTVKSLNGTLERLPLKEKPFSTYWTKYHPKRIIAQASGPTSVLGDVLMKSPQDSLKSDLYDIRDGIDNKTKEYNQRASQISMIETNLKKLKNEAPFLYVDGDTAKMVLITICAMTTTIEPQKKYNDLRNKLFNVIGSFTPISFSLIADEDRLDRLKKLHKDTPQYLTGLERLFLECMLTEEEAEEHYLKSLNNLVTRTLKPEQNLEDLREGTDKYDRKAMFHFMETEKKGGFCYHCFALDSDREPIDFLGMLLYAKREGLIQSAHIAFKVDDNGPLLSEAALSDGEYFWLARMGLSLLSRYERDSLFLFDEPDVHLNESWNIDFVRLLHELTYTPDNNTQEFIIATHSTLVLTDADPNQLYHFVRYDNKAPYIKSNTMSPFGANRDEISKRIFGTEGFVGNFSSRKLQHLIEKAQTVEELRELEKKVGPGLFQFAIRDRIYDMEHQND
ncbi:hypothetical protein DVH26_00255 [Paenibacillus sp. H1-7]|uniref:AAA family ATPase n=1 Tax=Paenibacillus sp. H1-7 TaxID=2282849 RepID=UPI001EF88D3A|nr:AAA family ATPase [Paenibacillus sp. H1-7]ULL13049.1 hypothetical protein DVH26_00255 [Paenibacillus sp. H1-7]